MSTIKDAIHPVECLSNPVEMFWAFFLRVLGLGTHKLTQ